MPTRNPGKQWAVTFPQCDTLDREIFAKSFPPCEECYVAREEHEGGGYHLHMSIKLLKGLSKSKLLKWVTLKYPDDWKRIQIQPVRSLSHWNEYLGKEDPDPFIIKREKNNKMSKLHKEAWRVIHEWEAKHGVLQTVKLNPNQKRVYLNSIKTLAA